ncbi:EAL domain-containing protein [Alphaproteobacteria bacterium KMM 3653]|uniref:EAL domain-containing protein n=1 Tax=Harenicola maris TaxID=2841044 RepID=A0AAP2G9V7_9RHOB|nr:EAL domain-containing protein [Harenicola maris]
MKKPSLDEQLRVPPGGANPIEAALSLRDRNVVGMVEAALARGDVLVAYQPVVSATNTDQVAFFETLIRLLDDTGRIVPAAEFIPQCEATEVGRKLDCVALEQGLRTLKDNPGLRLSVNMSARSIGYPPWLQTLETGLRADITAAERLIVEITESSAIVLPDLTSVFMRDLQLKGVSFALDDFGAGYTSFAYLRDFYFDIIKIDGQFIRGISENSDNQVLTRALLSIAQHFEMFTVAESVETLEDAMVLQELGVDCMQGFYYGAPSVKPPWRGFKQMQAKAG